MFSRVTISTTIVLVIIGSFSRAPLAASVTSEPQRTTDDAQVTDVGQLRRDAERGDLNAQYAMGMRYDTGTDGWQDYAEALKWFLKAAEGGLAKAQFMVGEAYRLGKGLYASEDDAFGWYLKSAEQGYARAQLAVGMAFVLGRGVEQSDSQAFPWLRRAAEQGLPEAQYAYGMRHPVESLAGDIATAMRWFRKAAEQGYEPAQFVLGGAYLSAPEPNLLVVSNTTHLDRDLTEAHMWLTLCWMRATGELQAECATSRDEAEKDMAQIDIADAQGRAMEWIAIFAKRQENR
jgi:TPR repeat protein